MHPLDVAIYAVASIGHAALWITAVNHLQARAIPRAILETICWPMRLCSIIGPLALVIAATRYDLSLIERAELATYPWGLLFYVGLCLVIALIFVPRWLVWAIPHQHRQVNDAQDRTTRDLSHLAEPPPRSLKARVLLSLPGNQSLHLETTHKSIFLPRLAPELDGLTIAHLSDVHITGDIACAWYDAAIDMTNELQADLIVLSGDLVEEAACWPWLRRTLGRLHAEQGVYYVLGNHDTRIDIALTRKELDDCGLIDLGTHARCIMVRESRVLLTGNELPWIKRADDRELSHPWQGVECDESALRIGVAHSPDQFAWAQQHGIDLLLAGHTHGGQIRIPGLGAIVSPSRFGARYCCGTYYESPTVMHVSRGLAGDTPIRWNCPPELTRLVLRSRVRRQVDDSSALGNHAPLAV